jgi:transcriptional regulator with PAS, ATPase and Fis domain
MERNTSISLSDENEAFVKEIAKEVEPDLHRERSRSKETPIHYEIVRPETSYSEPESFEEHVEVEESLSLIDQEKELILKALKKHGNRRKKAADELGISERTLYRKIKEYDI